MYVLHIAKGGDSNLGLNVFVMKNRLIYLVMSLIVVVITLAMSPTDYNKMQTAILWAW